MMMGFGTCYRNLTHEIEKQLYEKEKVKVKKAISSELQCFAITTDGWTSRANCSYISLTVHYINKNWEMCYHLLESLEDHTACNLAAGMQAAFDRWDLTTAILSAAITDNAKIFPWQLNN